MDFYQVVNVRVCSIFVSPVVTCLRLRKYWNAECFRCVFPFFFNLVLRFLFYFLLPYLLMTHVEGRDLHLFVCALFPAADMTQEVEKSRREE